MYTASFYSLPMIPSERDVRPQVEAVLPLILEASDVSADMIACMGGLPRLSGSWSGLSSLVRDIFARELMIGALAQNVELEVIDSDGYRSTPRTYSDMYQALRALPQGHVRRAVRVVLASDAGSYAADRHAVPQTYSYQAAAITVSLVPAIEGCRDMP